MSARALTRHTPPAQFRIEASFLGLPEPTDGPPAPHHSGYPAGDLPAAGPILAAARAIAALGAGSGGDHASQATVRVRTVNGGRAAGLPAESCSLVAEVRSPDDGLAERVLADVIDCLHDAANRPECTCDLDISVQLFSSLER